jgi:hypothetical protein
MSEPELVDPRTNFAVVIKMHTPDAHKVLGDPGIVRDIVGAALDNDTRLQEEIDYTLDTYRTEADTDTVTEHIENLKAEVARLESENKRLRDDLVAYAIAARDLPVGK